MTLVAKLDAPPDWMARASCLLVADPDIFFADPGQHAERTRALRVCRDCDVRPECLAHALRTNEAGIWGGTTGNQRQRLQPHRARPKRADHEEPPHGTKAGYDWHQRHRVRSCEACRAAHTAYVTERRIASRQVTLHRRAPKG